MVNNEYQKCCEIIGRLEDLEAVVLGELCVSLIDQFPETREFIIENYEDILKEEDAL